jgi:hypothetical protein
MGRAGQLCPGSSDVDLPRYSESVVDLNAEITHGALDLSMAKQKLDGTHVAGSAINQRRLGSVDRVRPDESRVEANAEYDLALFVSEPIERSPDGAPRSLLVLMARLGQDW